MSVRISAILAASLLLLSACGSSYPYREKTVQVENSQLMHTVHFPKGGLRMGLSEKRKLAEFVAGLRPQAVQQVEIETHSNSGLSHERAHLIKSELIKLGLPTPVFRHNYINRTVQNVNIHVSLAVVVPPKGCPDWASRGAPNFSNQIHSNYGCATRTNLALQAADPSDLVQGKHVGAPDADRTQALMVPYKTNVKSEAQAESTAQ